MRDFLPKSTSIARELTEINFLNLSPADRLTAGALQGLVNREEARICEYTGALFDLHEGDFRDGHEGRWLDLLEEEGIRRRPVNSLEELITAFPVAKGVILYNEDSVCERNIALMLGAQKNLLPATVAQAKRFGLARAEDLRGRFASAMVGYRWALDEIRDERRHRARTGETRWVDPFTFYLLDRSSEGYVNAVLRDAPGYNGGSYAFELADSLLNWEPDVYAGGKADEEPLCFLLCCLSNGSLRLQCPYLSLCRPSLYRQL